MAVAVAEKGADKRGIKRICMSCGTRFYDFNKRPAACPSCKAEFTGENKVKSRRGRAAAVEEDILVVKSRGREEPEAADDEEIVDGDDMVISLEDVEEMEEGEEGDDLESMDLDEDDEIGDLDDLEEEELEEEAGESLDEDDR